MYRSYLMHMELYANSGRWGELPISGTASVIEDRDIDYDHIDRLVTSFSPPNDMRELRFHILGRWPKVNLLGERETIAKIVKGPFPKLRKVAFSHHVTWVEDSVMQVVRVGESDTKECLDGWRPFVPCWLIAESSILLDESIVDQVSDYVQVQTGHRSCK